MSGLEELFSFGYGSAEVAAAFAARAAASRATSTARSSSLIGRFARAGV